MGCGFSGTDSALQDEESGDGGGGCTTTRVCLMPRSCALENDEDGECCVPCILPHLKINYFFKKHCYHHFFKQK